LCSLCSSTRAHIEFTFNIVIDANKYVWLARFIKARTHLTARDGSSMERGDEEVFVPNVLLWGTRGVRVKIWTFLFVNKPRWFTARQIAQYLQMPLSTVQVAIHDLLTIAPNIQDNDRIRSDRGRREKEYQFNPINQ
jgi:hypothetical protein